MVAKPFGTKYSWLAFFLLLTQLTPVAEAQGTSQVSQPNRLLVANIVVPTREIPDGEKLSFAKETAAETQSALNSLSERLKEAEKNKDLGLYNCLMDIYRDVDALRLVVETARVQMEDAIAQNQSMQVEHQYTKISICRSKLQGRLRKANECSSGEGGELVDTDDGDSKLIVDEAPLNPLEVGTDVEGNGDTIIAPPPTTVPGGS
ncbi:MAG: hypothetical protein ACKO6N_24655 [Myxococcota bacterium]